MQKKYLIVVFLLCFSINGKLIAGNYLPCGTATGNALVPSTTPGLAPGRSYNVSVGSSCDYLVPDMRIFWMSRTGRGWRQFGSIRQIPAPGTRVVLPSGGCANQTVQVTLTVDFYFNNGTPVNRRDDRYCSVDLTDRFFVEDKIHPVARGISISTSNPDFSPGALNTLFTASSFTDNCSPLSILQNNLEFVTDPRRPAIVEIRCGSTNTYRVSFRTRDVCGRYSNWAIAIVRFVDIILPAPPTIFSPSYFYTDSLCQAFISPSMLTVYSADDLTPTPQIRYSYRIISPAYLKGDIPASGRWLNASDACPVNGLVTLRVCAQDCSGNGNLHAGDDILDVNCDFVQFNMRDTLRPALLSECGNNTVELFANCTATMPNLASSLSVSDNCSAISIYQLPAPGSDLNEGISNDLGLAAGDPRPYSCEMDKEDDDVVDCTSSMGVFKSIPVSFILVDCDGNCTILRNCIIVNLTTTISIATDQKPGLKAANSSDHQRANRSEPGTRISNQPNPFFDFTDIRINTGHSGNGRMHFYTMDGRMILTRDLDVYPGQHTLRIPKQELGSSGLFLYSFSYKDTLSGKEIKVWNKMLVY